MTWSLQPCAASHGAGAVICDSDNTILARFDGPVWDENAEQLDERDRPAALMMTAAPELLRLVKRLRETAEWLVNMRRNQGDDEGARLNEMFIALEVDPAIARAEGRER